MQGRETWGDCTGRLSQRPGFADSPRHKRRRVFSSNYILAEWLQIPVWQTFARAKHCTWNAKKREGEMLCLCGRATICRDDWRWKITGQTNSCQTISVQVESNGSGALCWTLTGLTVSPSSPSNMCLLPSIAAPQLPKLDAASLWVTHRPDHPWSKERKGCCSLLPEECLAQARIISKAASSPGAPSVHPLQPATGKCISLIELDGSKRHVRGLCLSVLRLTLSSFHLTSRGQPVFHLRTFFGKYILIYINKYLHTYLNQNTNILQKAQ